MTKHFNPTTFCEYDGVTLYDGERFVFGISITDVGTETSHRYEVSGGPYILLNTDVLNHACDVANNIVDGFFRAGFEVVK